MRSNTDPVRHVSLDTCFAVLDEGILRLGNAAVVRRFAWNDGNLIGRSIEDLRGGHAWNLCSERPDVHLPGEAEKATGATIDVRSVSHSPLTEPHLQVDIDLALGGLQVRRRFRIYPNAPAIASQLLLKGTPAARLWQTHTRSAGELSPIETAAAVREGRHVAPVIERLQLETHHLRHTAVQFFDVTDRHNNLVSPRVVLAYRQPIELTGNLLLTECLLHRHGLFLLKEAPCSDVQLAWPGADFISERGEIKIIGIGIDPQHLSETEWTPGYASVIGVSAGSGNDPALALRQYQNIIRPHRGERDNTIVLNTWGDRSRDTRLSETFTVAEISAAAALGVTHLQLDDGWQAGRSGNSAFAGGTFDGIWSRDDFWAVHPDKFPNGFEPVLRAAQNAGVRIGLWYNPSKDDDYAAWKKDADQIVRLHRAHGIDLFKIDGVDLPTKAAELNFRRMLDDARLQSEGKVSFNLDVTAARRFGYFYFNEYGNKFLENRYTDYQSYYPHWTLRNLWQLSRFVPPQWLQIEFLNVWRNTAVYGGADPLSPHKAGFAYCFAVTMMAQPLAWFEASQLPAEALAIKPLIAAYRALQQPLHEGTIMPIGEEPCGTGWTGFQSIADAGGFVAVYREFNDRPSASLKLAALADGRVTFEHVLGDGQSFATDVHNGTVRFELPKPMAFALYKMRR